MNDERFRYAENADNKMLRARAVLEVAKALRSGVLVRPRKCERCSTKCKPVGHHHNYALPLEVEWLCASCHRCRHLAKHNLMPAGRPGPVLIQRISAHLGKELHTQVKVRCIELEITMQKGIIEAVNFWLKEGRKKEKAA